MTNDARRWGIAGIVLAVALGGVYYQYQGTRPCAEPVLYTIGMVDPRFGIATTTLLAKARSAAEIWNTAGEKTLLAYDPSAALSISLVYDERGAAAVLGREIARVQVALDVERERIEALEKQYEAAQNAYNEEVQAINARGGATPREALRLAAERRSLDQLAASLEARVASHNARARALNAKVDTYNETAGEPFEAGRYESSASGKYISVFFATDAAQLERVLAHELGHAIGLEHNGDPSSIMYEESESGNLVPSAADLADLKALCGA